MNLASRRLVVNTLPIPSAGPPLAKWKSHRLQVRERKSIRCAKLCANLDEEASPGQGPAEGKLMDDRELPPVAEIVCVSLSFGFRRPIQSWAALHIERVAGEYWARDELSGARTRIEARRIAALWSALQLPPLAKRDPAQFEIDVSSHYESIWTDDYPQFGLRLRCDDGSVHGAHSRDQHDYMIPWEVYRAGRNETTHDIRLARAIAAMLPDGFINQYRISGAGLYGSIACHEQLREQVEREMAEAADREPQPAQLTRDEEVLHAAEGPPLTFDLLNSDDDTGGVTAAAEEPTLWVLEQRLDEGGDPNATDEHGQTALMLAAFPPFNLEKFQLLVARGADVEARRYDGGTGLHLAASGGETEATQAWIDAGADVNAATPQGATALMLGVAWPDLAAALLAAGADPNLQDDDGDTAGVYLMEDGSRNEPWRLAILEMLLAAGLRTNLPNKAGQTLVDHIALWERRQDLEDRGMAELNGGPRRTWAPWRPLRTGWSALARLVAERNVQPE